ncbi:gluconokinase [Paracoccus sp. TOH]|uniref:gluconokinase n=1 Tax=Paracoccus sp. TOH TaxID=1263728 RepID=UPI0025AF9DCC|nr:gluconokinase [Paracoccus sp. TOH]WJS86274.1 gluconokinase [Paracoccus sp. TOH]
MSAALQHIVVMGVSGSGKSTTGGALAKRLGWPFIEGDSFHPAANVAKMRAGTPLTDADREPWLHALAAEIGRNQARGQCSVIGCSALKRAYRDILRRGAPWVRFLHVHGARRILEDRLAHREGHFFPARLLDSQLATLEMLAEDEDGALVDMALPVEKQVDAALRLLSGPGQCIGPAHRPVP